MYVILCFAGRNGWIVYDSTSSLTFAEKIRAESKYKKTKIINLLDGIK